MAGSEIPWLLLIYKNEIFNNINTIVIDWNNMKTFKEFIKENKEAKVDETVLDLIAHVATKFFTKKKPKGTWLDALDNDSKDSATQKAIIQAKAGRSL